MQPPIVPGPDPTPQYPRKQPDVVTGAVNTAGKAAFGTVIVVATLVGLFCVLPAFGCMMVALLGGLSERN